ncbi:hypothetical protein ACF1G4_27610 [Streptomyces caelestis]
MRKHAPRRPLRVRPPAGGRGGTGRQGEGATEVIADRDDIRLAARARAWFTVLEELGADAPAQPVFRALTATGRLASRAHATRRGKPVKGGAINESVQLLADRAGHPSIAGRKVRAHSLRAGANADMITAGAPRRERDRRGRRSPESNTADTVHDRLVIDPRDAPLSKAPLCGHVRTEV